MSFLKKTYKPYSFKWIVQRAVVVIVKKIQPDMPISMMEVKIPPEKANANLINTYFDCIYLLNLKYRSDKRLKSIQQLKKVGIKAMIVDGINGYQEPHKGEYEEYARIPLFEKDAHPLEFRIKRKCITSPGAWGVLKAKKMILLDAIKNKYKRILILQDDLFFIEDFHSRFEAFVKDVDSDWKIIALGATQHKWIIPANLSYRDPEIKEYDPSQKFYHPLVTDGAFAIGIDQSVFQMLIDETNRMNCSFDSGPVRAVYQKYHDKCFVCLPNLIIADVSTSDIREGRNQEEFSEKMHWDLGLYDMEKEFDLVSVIMPAYNAEKTIGKSIRSILIQTYKNLELIIIDDGSTDNTPKIAAELADDDKRVIFHRNEKHRGSSFVTNEALRISKGKYIAIQDPGDISLRTRMEKQLIPLVSGNTFVTFCECLWSHCNTDELDLSNPEEMLKLAESLKVQNVHKYPGPERFKLAIGTAMYSREMFEKYGLFWESPIGSDIEFLERLLYHELKKSFGSDNENTYSFIAEANHIDNAFMVVDETLYLRPEMDDAILTKGFENEEVARKEFFNKFRSKLAGNYEFEYPVF